MEDNEFWLWMNTFFIISITILLLALIIFYHFRIIGMAEKGYCEVQAYGTSSVLWQKCK